MKIILNIIFVLLIGQIMYAQVDTMPVKMLYNKQQVFDTLHNRLIHQMRVTGYDNGDTTLRPGFSILDLIGISLGKGRVYTPRKEVKLLENHVYHAYIINMEAVSLLLVLHDGKMYIYDEIEDAGDIIDPKYKDVDVKSIPKDEPTHKYYLSIKAYPKKIKAVLALISSFEYDYSEEDIQRIKEFNSHKYRLRNYK